MKFKALSIALLLGLSCVNSAPAVNLHANQRLTGSKGEKIFHIKTQQKEVPPSKQGGWVGTIRDLDKVTAILSDEITAKRGKAGKFIDEFSQRAKDAWTDSYLPQHSTLTDMLSSWVNSLASVAHKYLRTAPDVTSVLANSNNLMYTGTVYVGSNKQPLDLIFDTGSDWLVVEDISCTNCVSTIFKKNESNTFETNSTTSKALNYGSASLTGYTGNDTVGLDSAQSTAAPDFMFYLITKQSGISSSIDGIMGMSRNYQVGTYKPGPILHDYLYDAGEISAKVLAFFLGDTTDSSYCEIGGYTTTKFKVGQSIKWFAITDHFFWRLKIEGFRFGTSDTFADGSFSNWASPNTTVAIMDTGTSFMYIPSAIYAKFVAGLMKDLDYFETQGYVLGPCDRTQYKSVYFYVDGQYIEVTPDTYVLDLTYSSYCFLAISENSADYWLMGDSFLRNYITLWDEDNKRMGFVPHSTSLATISAGTLSPNEIIAEDNSGGSTDDFVNNFKLDFLQIGLIGGLFGLFSTTFSYTVIQVFMGYTFVPPLLYSLGLISESTASSWDDFFLWL